MKITFFLCLLFSLMFSMAFAAETTVFGPVQYIKTTDSLDSYTEQFAAAAGQGTLIVYNGDLDEQNNTINAIDYATISINGKRILAKNHFSRTPHLLEKTVDLTTANTLSINLTSEPGGHITIEIRQAAAAPEASVNADPATIKPGETSLLTWNTTNADTCEIQPDIGITSLSGSVAVQPEETTTYTLTATGPGGTIQADTTVMVGTQPPPEVSITATPEIIDRKGIATLSWASENADSVTIDQRIGSVALNGTMTVSPAKTTTYTITATGPGGTATASATVTLGSVASPDALLVADPATIQRGQTATLTWTSTNADACEIQPDIGAVEPNGSVTVSPAATTTYTLTATGTGGITTSTATVTVSSSLPPEVSISATPALLIRGYSATLSWISSNAESVEINQKIGLVRSSGSTTVSPTRTTTYTITATGPGGTAKDSVTITMTDSISPEVTISADPQTIDIHGSSILTWASTNADSCVIEPGVRDTSPSGSVTVSLSETTTYAITAIGPGGQAQDSVTITVNIPDPPLASISLDPATIEPGGSTVLTWTSENADTVEIDQGIGQVSQSGSVTITPSESTTYTITASGPGGTVTDSASVTVIIPPEVSLSASPETINTGQSTTLTWSSSNADTVEIDQGIGQVSQNGSVTITPSESTTYTITATGPGGTATDSTSVTVIIQEPTVTFSADPDLIQAGESSTLTWSSAHADTIIINQGIGQVTVDGSVSVTPIETTTYTITASGSGGTISQDVTVTISPITLSITSPLPDAAITRPDIMVTGTFANTTRNETGITVNGIPALVVGNAFAANHVLLEDGDNTLTVRARDTDGNKLSTSIDVNASTNGDYIELNTEDESGVSPLETTLTLKGSFDVTNPVISYSGPAGVEFLETTDETRCNVKITTPGLYTFTAEVTVDEDTTFSDTIVIALMDLDELDSLLTTKWNDMQTGLTNGNIDTTMNLFAYDTRDMFQYNFNLLKDHLPEMMAGMHDFTLVKITDGQAQYYVLGDQDGQTFSFYVEFIKDVDGIWRLRFF